MTHGFHQQKPHEPVMPTSSDQLLRGHGAQLLRASPRRRGRCDDVSMQTVIRMRPDAWSAAHAASPAADDASSLAFIRRAFKLAGQVAMAIGD